LRAQVLRQVEEQAERKALMEMGARAAQAAAESARCLVIAAEHAGCVAREEAERRQEAEHARRLEAEADAGRKWQLMQATWATENAEVERRTVEAAVEASRTKEADRRADEERRRGAPLKRDASVSENIRVLRRKPEPAADGEVALLLVRAWQRMQEAEVMLKHAQLKLSEDFLHVFLETGPAGVRVCVCVCVEGTGAQDAIDLARSKPRACARQTVEDFLRL